MSKGSEAIVGKKSLSLHFKSNTSSAKPRKIMQPMLSNAAKYSIN